MIQVREFYYPSADGVHTVHGMEWLPQGEPRAVVQIVHGVAEHIGRYDHVGQFFAQHGIAVCGEDHLGHGRTVEDGTYGYFAPKGGWDLLVRDIRQLRELEGKIRAYDAPLAKKLIPQGITCIIDHGHWTRDSRQQIIDACRADGLPYPLVWLTCPRGIRLQRLKQRNEQVRSSGEKGYVIDAEQLERFDSWFEELSEEERMHAEILETGNS